MLYLRVKIISMQLYATGGLQLKIYFLDSVLQNMMSQNVIRIKNNPK